MHIDFTWNTLLIGLGILFLIPIIGFIIQILFVVGAAAVMYFTGKEVE